MENNTDKRTKSQILRLLDEALIREDQLVAQLGALQTRLEDCLKREDDPRAELNEEALPATKIPFRIDYYKTAENGPFKGIVEHLPSREKKVFKGDGSEVLVSFIAGFLPEITEITVENVVTVPVTVEEPTAIPVASTDAVAAYGGAVPEQENTIQGTQLMQRLRESFRAEFSGEVV